MKIRLAFLILYLSAVLGGVSMRAQDAVPEKAPELRGVLADDSGKRFGLFIPASGQTGWATVGQSVGGWKLKEYRAADDTLVLAKEGREEILHLSESVVGVYHQGSRADAEALLKTMKLDERMFAAFKRGMGGMARQLLARNGIANPTPEQIAAVQKIVADQLQAVAGQFQAGMAGVMGEVYTQEDIKAQNDFYATSGGQAALDKMFGADGKPPQREPDELKAFYATAAGQSVQLKQSQFQAKLQPALQPLFGPMMSSTQKAVAAFAKQQGADVQASAAKAAP